MAFADVVPLRVKRPHFADFAPCSRLFALTNVLARGEWIVGVNVCGVLYGCKFFLPHLQQQDEAHIVNVSSMAGFFSPADAVE